MSLWEQTLINVQKGYDRLTTFAATFSERVKAEITIMRVRLQIDAARARMDEQHRVIGRVLLDLRESDNLPPSFDLFFKNSDIATALEKIGACERDLENLKDELRSEADALKAMPPRKNEDESS
jgi:hypothetical protein